MRCSSLLLVLALTASAAAERRSKPVAPVTVALTSVADRAGSIGGGVIVTLTATPTQAVPALTLRLDGTVVSFGPTPAGTHRTLTARVTREGDVVGEATIGHRSQATVLHLGAAKPTPAPTPIHVRTLRGGRVVGEVRA
ncbi:MAG: hypothetical protein NT062_04720 [Proteobacteria bacterium]|nr:hypothetical protein [Pseudomonadota bacterium]